MGTKLRPVEAMLVLTLQKAKLAAQPPLCGGVRAQSVTLPTADLASSPPVPSLLHTPLSTGSTRRWVHAADGCQGLKTKLEDPFTKKHRWNTHVSD